MPAYRASSGRGPRPSNVPSRRSASCTTARTGASTPDAACERRCASDPSMCPGVGGRGKTLVVRIVCSWTSDSRANLPKEILITHDPQPRRIRGVGSIGRLPDTPRDGGEADRRSFKTKGGRPNPKWFDRRAVGCASRVIRTRETRLRRARVRRRRCRSRTVAAGPPRSHRHHDPLVVVDRHPVPARGGGPGVDGEPERLVPVDDDLR